ncbi:MAG TPA: hypothetical protein VGQ71_12050 [Terriglobales bacterium]|nr:hypothetical protein [Terriglobales bacterium]
MPVDRDVLKASIHEAVGGDTELAALLEQKLAANDNLAATFTGGFLRNRDYTAKTQALADERRTLEGQVEQYRTQLESVEGEKSKVLRDLAQHKVSVAQAHARLKHLKDTYALSDDDVPGFADLIDTTRSGKPVDSSSSVDIDQKLNAFEKKITTYLEQKLVPELGGMAQLDIVWSDIRDEHRELTGKRLSAKEQQELFSEADRRSRAGRPVSLKALWEEKYEVPGLRQKHHDGELIKTERAKWEAEQQARLSEAAMAGIRPTTADQQGLRTSQIFNHKFKVHEEAAPATTAADGKRVTQSASERISLSGAERAGKRFVERRAQGVPMGAPDERKGGGGKAA